MGTGWSCRRDNSKKRDKKSGDAGVYFSGSDGGRDGIDVFSFGSAYLGPVTHPFKVVGDPSSPKFRVQNLAASPEAASRFGERSELLTRFDRTPAETTRKPACRTTTGPSPP